MRASIVSVGSEILRGTLLDTNAQYFEQELQGIGGQVVRVTQVPDDLESIVDAIQSSIDASDVVIISGGLGPTEDDLTREAIIQLTGESPVIDEQIVGKIRERFRLRGDEMPRRNEKQAWRIPSAQIIRNDNGTAPGWIVDALGSTLIAVPGPPRENHPMWLETIRPMLLSKYPTNTIVSRTIKTIGIGESSVADRIQGLIALGWPEVATYAKQDGVHITITASHPERAHADGAVRAVMDQVLQLLGDRIYGIGDESLASAITQPLSAAGIKMAVWEAGSTASLLNLLMADEMAGSTIVDARAWSTPDAYPGSQPFSITSFARDASSAAGVSTAAVLSTTFGPAVEGMSSARIDTALAHAERVASRSQDMTGSVDQILRRAVLFAAEFMWSEIRLAAGLHPAAGISSRSSRI